jgi:hypothetical protein
MENVFKFGNADFTYLIRAESYDITPNARQDLDSYRDADGVLQRTALSHTATTVEFDVKMLREPQMRKLMDAITGSYINYNERDAQCTYYDPETGKLKTGHFYIDSNLKFGLYAVWNGEKVYKETHFKFVEY